ncbi:V-type ATP synthase Subunit G [Gracilaria domingensis]|nr:V-type ATP synthase Subunit G [Gracilaria domingensis]
MENVAETDAMGAERARSRGEETAVGTDAGWAGLGWRPVRAGERRRSAALDAQRRGASAVDMAAGRGVGRGAWGVGRTASADGGWKKASREVEGSTCMLQENGKSAYPPWSRQREHFDGAQERTRTRVHAYTRINVCTFRFAFRFFCTTGIGVLRFKRHTEKDVTILTPPVTEKRIPSSFSSRHASILELNPKPSVKMSAEKPAETIQTLLEAEEEAKKLIETARKERDARLKQAASEADAEINEYRSNKESEYQAQKESYAGSSKESSNQIAAESKVNIKRTINEARASKQAVVDMLVAFVKTVSTS